jgi:hypothetical protein
MYSMSRKFAAALVLGTAGALPMAASADLLSDLDISYALGEDSASFLDGDAYAGAFENVGGGMFLVSEVFGDDFGSDGFASATGVMTIVNTGYRMLELSFSLELTGEAFADDPSVDFVIADAGLFSVPGALDVFGEAVADDGFDETLFFSFVLEAGETLILDAAANADVIAGAYGEAFAELDLALSSVTDVPGPATLGLLAGAVGLAGLRRKLAA